MKRKTTVAVSPLGDDTRASAGRRRAQNPRYAALEKKLELSLAIADLSILHRTRQNLTQRQLAELMGTSESAISRLESGFQNPTLDTLSKLAQALGGHVKIDIEFVADDAVVNA